MGIRSPIGTNGSGPFEPAAGNGWVMIDEILNLPIGAITYRFGKYLADQNPSSSLLETVIGVFDFEGHARAGLSTIAADPGYHQWLAYWQNGPVRMPSIYSCCVTWNEHILHLHVLTYDPQQQTRLYIVADTADVADAYFDAVSRWSYELRSQILVFEGGCWSKDDALYADIQNATFENLILAGDLAAEIKREMDGFFASREVYARYRIPWKRGVLLIGPPGNGKTHAVKALLNSAQQNCLYVKSFDLAGGMFPQAGVSMVFERARQTTPCLLVLEDLDSLVGPHNRSFFLNELDGFASNEGIVVLATTNHPERLDSAILERPSRFDRKYTFALPGPAERESYIRLWNTSLESALTLDDTTLTAVAEATDGFSFAYLRELFLSSLMRWISDGATGSFGATILGQIETLREQMLEPQGIDMANAAMPGGFSDFTGALPAAAFARAMQGANGAFFSTIGRTRTQ
jgi:hypothetical protein